MRAITNSDYRAHSVPLFSKSGNLEIYQINTFQIAKFMYCYHNNLLPPLVFNLFLTNSQIHGYSTRKANHYRVHHCRTNLKKNYNSLPRPNSKDLEFPSCCSHFLGKFSQLEQKTARVFSKIITELAKPHTCSTFYLSILLCTRLPQL